MGLTDKAIEIALGALLLVTLIFLAEQEISLRHANHLITTQLNTELQCRVGSACAKALSAEVDRGALLVEQARAAAAAEAADQKASLDKQATDAAREQAQAAEAARQEALDWKQKYQQALQAPSCAAWAKQAVSCVVH